MIRPSNQFGSDPTLLLLTDASGRIRCMTALQIARGDRDEGIVVDEVVRDQFLGDRVSPLTPFL